MKIKNGDLISSLISNVTEATEDWLKNMQKQLDRIGKKQKYTDWLKEQDKKPCCGDKLKEELKKQE